MTVTFTATGDVSALEREYMRLQKQYAGLSAELAKLTAAQGDFERSGADASKIKNLAAQQYVATVRILSDELRKGAITQAQHDAQLGAAKEKYAAITREAKEQAAATRQLATASKDTGDAWDKLPKPIAQAKAEILGIVTGFAGAYLSVQGIVGQIQQWRDLQRTIRSEQARTQLDVAGAEAEAIQMLGTGVSKETKTGFLADVKQLNQDTGFGDLKNLYLASANVLSSTAGDPTLTKQILRATAPIKKYRPDELESLSGSVADLSTIVGDKTDEDVQKTTGLVLNITSLARIKSLSQFKEAAPALAAVTTMDTSGDKQRALREAGAVFAAVGGSIKDPEGALTKTATSELAGALQRMVPEKQTLAERLAHVQSSPELQKEFWEKHGDEIQKRPGFRAPIMPVMKALMSDPNSEVAVRYRSALAKLTSSSGEQNMADYKQMVADVSGLTPELALASGGRQSAAAIQAHDVDSTGGRRSELERQTTAVKSRVQTFEGWIKDKTLGAVSRKIARWSGLSEEQIAAQDLGMVAEEQRGGNAAAKSFFGVSRPSTRVESDAASVSLVESESKRLAAEASPAERTAAAVERLEETVANRPQVGTSAMAAWGMGAQREGRGGGW